MLFVFKQSSGNKRRFILLGGKKYNVNIAGLTKKLKFSIVKFKKKIMFYLLCIRIVYIDN